RIFVQLQPVDGGRGGGEADRHGRGAAGHVRRVENREALSVDRIEGGGRHRIGIAQIVGRAHRRGALPGHGGHQQIPCGDRRGERLHDRGAAGVAGGGGSLHLNGRGDGFEGRLLREVVGRPAQGKRRGGRAGRGLFL